MDLSPVKTSGALLDDKQWLGSKHGTDCTRTITLDIAGGTFDAVATPDVTRVGGYKVIPSGTPVIELGSGLYARCQPAEAADFHLFESVFVTDSTENAGAAGLWHGVIVAAKVPLPFVEANQAAANILYV